MTPRSGHRLVSGLSLVGLGVLGIAGVTVPVTLALVFHAPASHDPAPRSPPEQVVLWDGSARAASPIHPSAAVAAIRCRPTRGWYALTFDGGPLPRRTRALARAIRRAHAIATFFVIGARAAEHPALLDVQRRVGIVASHGFTHANLTRVSHERRVEEMAATARLLGHPNRFFRPPFGASNPAADADIAAGGLVPVYWTVDATHGDRAAIVRRALRVRPGGIVLLNEGSLATIRAIPTIVRQLRARGLCPGFLRPAEAGVQAPRGQIFHVEAVRP